MITNEILLEKNRVERELSESAQDINDYYVKSHESAQAFMEQYRFPVNRQNPNGENLLQPNTNEN